MSATWKWLFICGTEVECMGRCGRGFTLKTPMMYIVRIAEHMQPHCPKNLVGGRTGEHIPHVQHEFSNRNFVRMAHLKNMLSISSHNFKDNWQKTIPNTPVTGTSWVRNKLNDLLQVGDNTRSYVRNIQVNEIYDFSTWLSCNGSICMLQVFVRLFMNNKLRSG